MKRRTLAGLGMIPAVLILIAVWRSGASVSDQRIFISQERPAFVKKQSMDARPPRPLAVSQWKREVETLLAEHEARRCRILSCKQGVDAEIILLAVEPPSEQEIDEIRNRIDQLSTRLSPAAESRKNEHLKTLIADYDPFGKEGKRVIQIDLPDEPNGRITGFTCRVEDFQEIEKRFIEGEMTNLENLRSYSANWAGMPLERFSKLIAMDGE